MANVPRQAGFWGTYLSGLIPSYPGMMITKELFFGLRAVLLLPLRLPDKLPFTMCYQRYPWVVLGDTTRVMSLRVSAELGALTYARRLA